VTDSGKDGCGIEWIDWRDREQNLPFPAVFDDLCNLRIQSFHMTLTRFWGSSALPVLSNSNNELETSAGGDWRKVHALHDLSVIKEAFQPLPKLVALYDIILLSTEDDGEPDS